MAALSEHINVYTTAIAVLEDKRFSIWHDRETDTFCAQRDGWDFRADNPVSLLGLVAIFEYKNPSEYISSWWETEGSIRYPNVPDNAPEYTPVYARFRHQSERE